MGKGRHFAFSLAQGASKTGQTPDGSSYLDVAESDAVKDLLK